MSWPETLLPVAVLLPLGAAALLLALEKALPRRSGDIVATLVAAITALLCGWLAQQSVAGPITHWFGGWSPPVPGHPGVVLGIAFMADPASAGVAAFCGVMFTAALLFAWNYFDAIGAHFHVLMLLFLAAMVGFCLTHDLFDLFVWFEVMSVAAYALTAYPLGPSSLEGAINFTVVNSLASFLMLAGTGLLYARTGALDYSAIGKVAAHAGADPVTAAGFILVAIALLTKGACVPFHFWLADAHSVAPSPVSVIFSGAMVSLALFGLAKLLAIVFVGNAEIANAVHAALLWLGAATAVIAALTAWAQRHLKRLLAFSTIAHLGIMLTGVAAADGHAGLLLYLVGHGLVKGSLFMIAGMLLALRASVDEIDLYNRARPLWPIGLTMALAGLLLGGLPLGLLHGGADLISAAKRNPVIDAAQLVATSLTGAAVLRAALRIFAGVSGAPGPERNGPSEREHENNDRPLWLMLAPCAALLALNFIPAAIGQSWATLAATSWGSSTPNSAPESLAHLLAPTALTLILLAAALLRRRPAHTFGRRLARMELAPFTWLQRLHSGRLNDYVAWLAFGLAGLATAFL